MRRIILAAALLLASGAAASAADPIVGKWRAPGGGIVEVTSCGSSFCAKVISGRHKGKSAGEMNGEGGQYKGTVTDPRDDKTYNGSATIEGNTLNLTGCALKIFCKTQQWNRA